MPIKKAAFKDLKQRDVRAAANKKVKDDLHYLMKKCRKLLEKNELSSAKEWIERAVTALDKAAQKGIIKKNTASRKKSRLVKKLQSGPEKK